MAAGREQCLAPSDVGIVLIHGFGGGVFAWRHLLQPLADAVGVRVVAFDRPGFGEHMLAVEAAGVRVQCNCLWKQCQAKCAWTGVRHSCYWVLQLRQLSRATPPF
jgi:hypothetical protein